MKIFVIDDEVALADLLVQRLAKLSHSAEAAYSGEDALARLPEAQPQLVLSDHFLGDATGLELLPKIKALLPKVPVVMMTGTGSSKLAVQSMKAGAEDYLEKPINFEELAILVEKIGERQNLKQELEEAKETRREEATKELNVFAGEAMREVYDEIESVAAVERVTVLVHGETGTGKEHVSKLLHMLSRRSLKPFVEFNCAAFPDHLAESELFGYEAGAFTDAKKPKRGLLESAQGGTVFFDEVGELSLSVQAKLLKVLEDKEVRRLGSLIATPLDVRIVAATNRRLQDEVKAGRFREDLFFRLDVYSIEIPPLRERKEDLRRLANFFWENACSEFGRKATQLSSACLGELEAYRWPGNVRELRNVMERLAIRSRGIAPELTELHKAMGLAAQTGSAPMEAGEGFSEPGDPGFPGLKGVLDASGKLIKRRLILRALELCHGNKTEAAKLLQVDYKTLYNLSKELELSGADSD